MLAGLLVGESQSPQIGSSVQSRCRAPGLGPGPRRRNPLKSGQAFKVDPIWDAVDVEHPSQSPQIGSSVQRSFAGSACLSTFQLSQSPQIGSSVQSQRADRPPGGCCRPVAIPSNRVKRSKSGHHGGRVARWDGRNPLKSGQAFKVRPIMGGIQNMPGSQSPQIGSSVQRINRLEWIKPLQLVAIPSNRVKRSKG